MRNAFEKVRYVRVAVIVINGWYGDPNVTDLFERVTHLLSQFKHVVFLTPSTNPDRAYDIIRDRSRALINGVEFNEHFITHPSNRELAKHIVYTKGKSPLATRDEIIGIIDPTTGPVILIGPIRAGKSTQGKLVAEALGRQQVALDAVRWDYYKEIGWTQKAEDEIRAAEGFPGVYRSWKQFEIHAVERVIADYPECVIDFGAGHSVYETPDLLERAKTVLSPISNVILLLPSPDTTESVEELRIRDTVLIDGLEATQFMLTSDTIQRLASIVVSTEGRTAEECATAIAQSVK